MVIKEALRLHPPICFPLERVVPPEGVSLCGHEIPGGTIVGVMAPVMNQNTDIFGPDAETFRPERWLEADAEHLKVMDRNFTSVSHPPYTVFPTTSHISQPKMLVWPRDACLYWEEHCSAGDFQVCPTGAATFLRRVGISVA